MPYRKRVPGFVPPDALILYPHGAFIDSLSGRIFLPSPNPIPRSRTRTHTPLSIFGWIQTDAGWIGWIPIDCRLGEQRALPLFIYLRKQPMYLPTSLAFKTASVCVWVDHSHRYNFIHCF